MSHPIVVAMTGASGAIYGVRLLETLANAGRTVCLTISPAAKMVLEAELGLKVDLDRFAVGQLLSKRTTSTCEVRYFHHQDLMSPIASGSFLTAGMVVCPCSGGTLGAIAHSMGSNLVHRAAEVHLKERRKLILVPRETPLSLRADRQHATCDRSRRHRAPG